MVAYDIQFQTQEKDMMKVINKKLSSKDINELQAIRKTDLAESGIYLTPINNENRAALFRISAAVRCVGESCAICGHTYNSVDDLLEKDPSQGWGSDIFCKDCSIEYEKIHGKLPHQGEM